MDLRFGLEGGRVTYKYEFKSCGGKNTVTFSSSEPWCTVSSDEHSVTINVGGVQQGAACDGGTRNAAVSVTLNGKECANSTFNIKQECLMSSCCDDINLNIKALADSGYTTTTQIGTWSYAQGSSCSSAPTLTCSDTRISGLKTTSDGKITIDSLAKNDDELGVTFRFSVVIDGESCGEELVTQDGSLFKCTCENAGRFIRFLKRTFTFNGTNNQEILIGSGKTSCGNIEFITDSDMVENNELRVELNKETKEFNMYAKIFSQGEGGHSRSCGISAYLYDEDGKPVSDSACPTGYELIQSDKSCMCDSSDSFFYFPHHYGWEVRIDGAYWVKVGEGGSTNSPIEFYRSIRSNCKDYYFEYDENLFGASATYPFTFETKRHWLVRDQASMNFAINPSLNLSKPITTKIKIKEYVDTTVEDDELTIGYPCDTEHEYTIVLFGDLCTCDLEGAARNLSSYISYGCYEIDKDGGTVTGSTYEFYCAEDVEFKVDWGEYGQWGTFENKEGTDQWGYPYKYWEITAGKNTSGNERKAEIYAIPIINGEKCDLQKYANCVEQPPSNCDRCEDVMADVTVKDEQLDFSSCNDYAKYEQPGSYNGACGTLSYEIVDIQPKPSADDSTAPSVTPMGTQILIYPKDYTQTIKYRAYVGDSTSSVRPYPNILDGCYSDVATLTVNPCEEEECNCYTMHSYYSFTLLDTLTMEGDTVVLNNNAGDVQIGTVGNIDSRDECIYYEVVSTQQDVIEGRVEDRRVIATVKDIGSVSTRNVTLTVNMRDQSVECNNSTRSVSIKIVK